MTKLFQATAAAVAVAALASPAAASRGLTADTCVDAVGNCDFYLCLEDAIPCVDSKDSYAIDYGHHFCNEFVKEPFTTQQARDWRDSVLSCLQESLIPLDQFNDASCSDLRSSAFDSHPKCYTKAGNSICDLPRSDIRKIVEIAAPGTLSVAGVKQMAEVGITCPNIIWKTIRVFTFDIISGWFKGVQTQVADSAGVTMDDVLALDTDSSTSAMFVIFADNATQLANIERDLMANQALAISKVTEFKGNSDFFCENGSFNSDEGRCECNDGFTGSQCENATNSPALNGPYKSLVQIGVPVLAVAFVASVAVVGAVLYAHNRKMKKPAASQVNVELVPDVRA